MTVYVKINLLYNMFLNMSGELMCVMNIDILLDLCK